MILSDRHTHTTFSDGENTPEEMVQAAIAKGAACIGISDHSCVPFDPGYCMDPAQHKEYIETIAALKEKYSGQIEVQCGIEQDLDSDPVSDDYDYVIGSVHYLSCRGENIAVDLSPDILKHAAKKYFRGDFYSLAESYFARVGLLAEKQKIDIIGHFDLIRKFNRRGELFDPQNKRYRRAWKAAADRLLAAGIPFEINTSPLSCGQNEPYPSMEIINYLDAHGAKFVISSDAHRAEDVCRDFGSFEFFIK